MKIMLSALALAIVWMVVLISVEQSPGIHSTPGIWVLLLGFPGVAAGISISDSGDNYIAHVIMFFVNWVFYFGIIFGFVFLKRKIWK